MTLQEQHCLFDWRENRFFATQFRLYQEHKLSWETRTLTRCKIGHQKVVTGLATKRSDLISCTQIGRLVITMKQMWQCFSTFLLQRNFPQTFALLVEPYAVIQVHGFARIT